MLEEESDREMAIMAPSEVVNEHADTDRVILIDNLKNGGGGGRHRARLQSGAATGASTVRR